MLSILLLGLCPTCPPTEEKLLLQPRRSPDPQLTDLHPTQLDWCWWECFRIHATVGFTGCVDGSTLEKRFGYTVFSRLDFANSSGKGTAFHSRLTAMHFRYPSA